MSTVWMAENLLIRKRVAIKLMHPEFARNPRTLARFRNEATAAGTIGSAHICDILDFGQSQLGPYIVMERLVGASFGELLDRAPRLEPGLSALIIRQGLAGLDAAHKAGIIHRDLKPENLFIHEPEPGRMTVKLMDFGISKFTEEVGGGKTGAGVLMGTPEYMSPEQAEGAANVDARTDIWAMGVMLYRAVTGVDPFAGPTLAATLLAVTTKEAQPISSIAPEVPIELARVIDRCLAKGPQDRYATCGELSDALAPFEEDMALPPGGAGSYLKKAVTRLTTAEGQAPSIPIGPPGGTQVVSGGDVPNVAPNPAASPPANVGAPAATSAPPLASPSGAGPVSGPINNPATGSGGAQRERQGTWSNEIAGLRAPEQSWTMGVEEVDDRPRRRSGGGGKGALIAIFIVLLLLGGGGFYAWYAGLLDGVLGTGAKGSGDGDAGTDTVAVGESSEGPEQVRDAGGSKPDVGGGEGPETGGEETDAIQPDLGGSATPSTEGPETDTAETEAGDGTPETGPKPTGPKVQLSKVYRAGSLYAPKKIPPVTNYSGAVAHCKKLKDSRHAGLRKWKLASASQALKFKSKGVTKTKYWTSRRVGRKAWTVNLFSGAQSQATVGAKGPRPFCVSTK
jgi:serine/threonine-protein kinase